LPIEEPGIEGIVLRRDTEYNVPIEVPTMLVRDDEDPCGVVFVIDSATQVVTRSPAGKLIEASERDATVGSHVRVWFSGMAESCPGQSYAEVVEIVTIPRGQE
jgi:hypothetical protein